MRSLTQLGLTLLACFQATTLVVAQTPERDTKLHPSDKKNTTAASVTFSQHVAQIVYDKCSSCHRPGQVGPFPLLTYEQVAQRATTIEAVIEDQYMPPWKPVNKNVHFANDRRLSAVQKKTISEWIAQGKLQGDPELSPQIPEYPGKWLLGEPDLVVKMKGRFQVPASGPDVYRSFVFPIDLPEEKWVKAVELRPTAKASVHHGLFFVDTEKAARTLDDSDEVAGIKGMSFLAFGNNSQTDTSSIAPPKSSGGLWERFKQLGRQPASQNRSNDQAGQLDAALARGLGGYVPGAMPALLPDDLAMHLPAGSDVVMQTHFHPSGKIEYEEAELALYFSDQPPSQRLVPIQVPAMFGFGAGIDVPAGDHNFVVEDTFQLPIEVEAISIGGHAHYICREMSLTAQLPNGEKQTLMQIDDWDLDWQDRYYFADRIALPAGTILNSRLVYDNSEENPENPNIPPQRIKWGRQSEDEMGSVTLAVVAKNEAQRSTLEHALREHFRKSVLSKFRSGFGMVRLLKQLDSNRDGLLQPEESPPRLARNFRLFDTDRNNALDKAELKRVAEVVSKLGIGVDK